MVSWFHSRPGRRKARQHRLTVEPLEERTLLATRMVVPLSQPVDNVTTFHDLATAVNAAVTVSGDTIQIEPNSVPGGATVNKPLVVQGDPNNGPLSLPQLGNLILAANGIVLQNLNLHNVTIGSGQTQETLRNNTLVDLNQQTGLQLNGGNLVSGNRISGKVFLGNGPVSSASGDQVLDNSFMSSTPTLMLNLDRDDGAVIAGNRFVGSANATTALQVDDSLSLTVRNNVLLLTGAASVGILVDNPDATASVRLLDNRIETNGQGTGIETVKKIGNALLANIANNDLVENLIGIKVVGDGTPNVDAFGLIDAGGGGLSSLGGNDFHFYTGAAGHFAVTTTNALATTAAVSARDNIFTLSNPASVVSAGTGGIDVSQPLSANGAFVDRLYDDFFLRSANPAQGSELSFWTDQLAHDNPRVVAKTLLTSREGRERLVDRLYLGLLGRAASTADEDAWVRVLQHGKTLEQVIGLFLSSTEFGNRANTLVGMPADTNTNFIQALYGVLLGRTASTPEVGIWLALLPHLGRRKTAELFARSTEFRRLFVRGLYFSDAAVPSTAFVTRVPNLLHRPVAPSDAEIAGWVKSRRSLGDVTVSLASSAEFFGNG